MNVPAVDQPQRYRGLYVFDFGEWSAIGYTAAEIATLLESEQFRDGHVYKIHRVSPDGSMELRGVAHNRFHAESGLIFYRGELTDARSDFETLKNLGGEQPAPCRAFVHLVKLPPGDDPRTRYATALVYPAEYDDEISRWLLDVDYQGGDRVEGGISHVTNLYETNRETLDRHQLWSREPIPSRSRDEIFGSVRDAVQR